MKLKESNFHVLVSATDEEIIKLWHSLKELDDSLDVSVMKNLSNHPNLQRFIYRRRHHSLEVRKCGVVDCSICKPPKLPKEVFEQLRPLPDPTPGADGHYLPFHEVFGQDTSEKYRPSLNMKTSIKKSLPFSGSKQHVKNVGMMLMCEECEMWRLMYRKQKLKKDERSLLEQQLDGLVYTCGSSLQDLDLPKPLDEVYVRNLNCGDPVEKLYYTSGYEPIYQ